MFQFIHAADIHLDSPLRGLHQYEGAPGEAIRQASRRALENMVALALREKVAFVLIAGDLYDGDWRDYNTGLFFTKQMVRLREANIGVYVIAGNHDADNKMTRSLRLPDNVRMLSSSQPESIRLANLGVAIHGQGFAQAKVIEDLSLGYPQAQKGDFNIGLLHTCVGGAEGHERYAPCTIDGLRSKDYDYWALGHIHKRECLLDHPYIAFPGNMQGRHIRETGPKGCLLVRVEEGRPPQVNFQPLDVMRWEVCAVRAEEDHEVDDILESIERELRRLHREHEKLLAVRVHVTGRTAAHQGLLADPKRWAAEVQNLANGSPDQMWIENVRWQTSPLRTSTSDGDDGPISELLHMIGHLATDLDAWTQLIEECDDIGSLTKKSQAMLPELAHEIKRDDSVRQRTLGQVEALLRSRLHAREEER